MYTRTRLNDELATARQKLADLEAEADKLKKQEETLTPAQNVAVTLHERLCRGNHTDYCDWYYRDLTNPQTWTGEYSTHKKYLEKAEKALAVADGATIINVLEAVA